MDPHQGILPRIKILPLSKHIHSHRIPFDQRTPASKFFRDDVGEEFTQQFFCPEFRAAADLFHLMDNEALFYVIVDNRFHKNQI